MNQDLMKVSPCLRENKHLSVSHCDLLLGKTNLPCAYSLLTPPVPKSWKNKIWLAASSSFYYLNSSLHVYSDFFAFPSLWEEYVAHATA